MQSMPEMIRYCFVLPYLVLRCCSHHSLSFSVLASPLFAPPDVTLHFTGRKAQLWLTSALHLLITIDRSNNLSHPRNRIFSIISHFNFHLCSSRTLKPHLLADLHVNGKYGSLFKLHFTDSCTPLGISFSLR
jgi:hypothetical protein